MTHPTRYLVRICVFLLVIIAVVFALRDILIHAFMVNPGLNGVIIAILLLGIAWNLHLTLRLIPEVRWVTILQQPREGLRVPEPPLLLAPMARLLRARREENPKLTLSTHTTRAMLESLEARMDEGRDISRYITQLLVFLGLLGTFYGLILTVRSVADVISAMPSGGADLAGMFDHIKMGLTKPLMGMSTAFSASMFGLAGSLILGFLDLTSGQAQNRFANEIEEWLADLTFLDTPAENTPNATQKDPQTEDAIRAGNVAILRKLDELNATLRHLREPTRQPLAPLEEMLYQLDKNNQATLHILQNLNNNIKQHHAEDPSMTHLVQEMGQKLTSLRSDIAHLFQRDHKTRSTQRRED